MDSIEKLKTLSKSEIVEVKEASDKVLSLIAALKNNEINKSEFDELLDDVIKLEYIQTKMNELDCYISLKQIYDTIIVLQTLPII